MDQKTTSPQHSKHHAFEREDSDSGEESLHGSQDESPTSSVIKDKSGRNLAPVQKRRRVTRACDECRRKKIKCDGKQPCTHCTVYSYDCTYDQPSNRRRNAAPQYMEALEAQLQRANAILKLVLPHADLSDPNLEFKLQTDLIQRQQHLQHHQALAQTQPQPQSQAHDRIQIPAINVGNPGDAGVEALLESMVRSTGQLDLDERGHLEYHGHSSGLSFVRKMREQLGDNLLGPEAQDTPFIKTRPMHPVYDSPRAADSPYDVGITHDLPSREVALALCDIAVNDATALMRFVHWPTFERQVNRAYDIPADQYGNEENTFLPLLYATLALATLFSKKEGGDLDQKGYMNAIGEGFKYFRASRQLMDIADCRDIPQLQAIVFMIMFLQGSAKLSVCYAYIGVALRSALRMGLHRNFPDNFTPIENETRKRLFWTIRKMDVYVGALLGLPHTINRNDVDQEYPLEVEDEYITDKEIKPMPAGQVAVQAASNAHTDLVNILEKIVRYVYPLKGMQNGREPAQLNQYSVSYSQIQEIERDLQAWQDKLPMGLKPGGEASPNVMRVQHLLRISYAHAQMMLYRPFLHYVSTTCKSKAPDKRSYACAAACVSVSQNVVHIAIEMKKRGLLVGSYWFTMYTTFFAILTLVFYALENPENQAAQNVLAVAREGRDILEASAKRSMAADRCTDTLSTLFSQLPEVLSRNKQQVTASRKRRQDAPPKAHTTDSHRMRQDPSMLDTKDRSRRVNSYPSPRSDMNKSASSLTGLSPAASGKPQARVSSLVPNQTMPSILPSAMPFNTSPSSVSTSTFNNGSPQGQLHNIFPTTGAFGGHPQGFSLDDMTSLLFPSNDPFDYPDQSVPPTQSYDQPLKELGGNQGYGGYTDQQEVGAGRSLPYGNHQAMPHQQQQQSLFTRNPFNPSPSTSNTDLSSTAADPEMPLLGPMPMYLMQGGGSAAMHQVPSTAGNRYGQQYQQQYAGGAGGGGQQWQQQGGASGKGMQGPAIPDVNLQSLLGDATWGGAMQGGSGGQQGAYGSSGIDGGYWMQ